MRRSTGNPTRTIETALVALVLCVGAAVAADEPIEVPPTLPPVCTPDANLDGIRDALLGSESELTSDAWAIILSYQVERASLCRRLEASQARIDATVASRDLMKQLVSIAKDDSRMYMKAYEELVDRPGQEPYGFWKKTGVFVLGGLVGWAIAD